MTRQEQLRRFAARETDPLKQWKLTSIDRDLRLEPRLRSEGETKMARTNQRSPITRSAYAIRSPSQRDEVFGTHSLDHVIVFGERHLRHVLRSYARYYNGVRTHLSLGKDSPLPRDVQAVGTILPLPVVQGLHHHYVRI